MLAPGCAEICSFADVLCLCLAAPRLLQTSFALYASHKICTPALEVTENRVCREWLWGGAGVTREDDEWKQRSVVVPVATAVALTALVVLVQWCAHQARAWAFRKLMITLPRTAGPTGSGASTAPYVRSSSVRCVEFAPVSH
jgi:hypothetical protein